MESQIINIQILKTEFFALLSAFIGIILPLTLVYLQQGNTYLSFYINKKYRNRHRGWDFRAPIGTKIRASNNGVVVLIDKFKAFGGTVVLDHGQGVFSLFFHLSKFLIKEGDYLEKGDVLGLTGNTGVSSGPHLHWGLSVHNVRVEPKSWVLTVMP